MSSRVTTVTPCASHSSASGLFFGDDLLNAARFGSLVRARRSAQKSSPLAPLQRNWRGIGRASSAMPKFAKTLRARELRQHETYTEALAWSMLRDGRFLGSNSDGSSCSGASFLTSIVISTTLRSRSMAAFMNTSSHTTRNGKGFLSATVFALCASLPTYSRRHRKSCST